MNCEQKKKRIVILLVLVHFITSGFCGRLYSFEVLSYLQTATPVIGLLVSDAFLSSWTTNMQQIKERQTKTFLKTCTFEKTLSKKPQILLLACC